MNTPAIKQDRIPGAWIGAAERAGLALVAFIAIAILFAWLSPAFASLLPHGWDLMKVNTAAGMLLAAMGLWTSGTMTSPRASASFVLGAVLSLLALLILLEHFAGIHLRMDTWLAADAAAPNPGMTSAHTAIGLLLLGMVVPCVTCRVGAMSMVADALAFALVGFLLVLLSGYLYGAARLVGESSLIRVSPQTLACFVLLTSVTVARRTVYGGFSSLLKQTKVGRVVLITAPLVIALIYATGFFYIYVRQNGYLSRSDGVALSVSALSMVVLYVILVMAKRINRLEQNVRDLLLGHSRAELQESEQRYAELVDQALEGITVRKPTGEFLFVNDTFCSMLGYTHAEFLHMRITDVVHPEDAETIKQVQELGSGGSLRLEKRMLRKDGHVVHVEVSARRLSDGNLQSTIQDVSERKRGEERFRAMVEGSPTAMLMVSEQGSIAMVNPQAERLFGYERAELLNRQVDALVPEPFRSLHPALRAGFHRDPKTRVMGTGRDLYGLRKDGEKVPVEIGLNPIATPEGRFVLASIIDISERKRAEERFRAMVEGAPNAMVMVDERGMITLANPQTEKLFGYSVGELLGHPVEMLIPERFHREHPALRTGYNRDPQMRSMGIGRDLYGLRKDGVEVPVEIGLNPITTHEGRFVLASIIDITERRAAEKRDHLYQEELRLMSQRLLEAQETERRAIARELHDEIGQALTATRMNLRDLEQQAGDGPLGKRAADASAIVAQLLQQVRQLSLDLHPTVLDDLGLAASLRWLIRTRLGSSELNVTQELAEDLPRFTSTTEHTLFRVFQEALSNVLRHSGARNLEVRLALVGSDLQLDIRDDGKGFDPNAARKHALAGASLGVIGMQERVRLAGGRIVIESKPGQGTRIQVSLPAMERQET